MGSPETCPFCRDTDFDLVGLKWHLTHGDCYEYETTSEPARTARIAPATPPATAASADDRAKAAAPGRLFIACNDAGYFPSGGIASLKENTTYFALKHPEYPFVVEYEKVAPAASAVTRAAYDAVLAVLAECRDLISRRMVAKGVNREQQAAQRAEARIILQRIDAALRGTNRPEQGVADDQGGE